MPKKPKKPQRASESTKAATPRQRARQGDEPISITWALAELPSAQHRAGLAGLVMLVAFTRRYALPAGAVLEAVPLDEVSYSLKANLAGLSALFDRTYAAARGETERAKPWMRKLKDGTKAEVPPKRREQRSTPGKNGVTKQTEVCIYDITVPHGGPLGEFAPLGDEGRWIELWRSWLWSILRGIPKQRTPYELRAGTDVLVEGGDDGDGADPEEANDVLAAWDCLAKDGSVKQASTYYLGAMDANAEQVPFRDRSRHLFLLHFWPFATHVFVPRVVDVKGKTERDGFVACIPEVAQLATFVRRHERALKARSPDGDRVWNKTPKQAVVDLAEAAALESSRWLEDEVAKGVQQADARATAGFQVIHCAKSGNSVRIRSSRLIAPSREQVDQARIVGDCWSHLAKHQLLTNIMAARPWWSGFERACSTASRDMTIKDGAFRHDARVLFDHFHPEDRMTNPADTVPKASRPLESIVLHIVQGWITGRLEGKYQLRWADVKGQPGRQAEYDQKRSKLATEAFLAARSRPGREFARWFTATLCSVTQRLTEPEFVALARALEESPDQVRSLTLLALSARG